MRNCASKEKLIPTIPVRRKRPNFLTIGVLQLLGLVLVPFVVTTATVRVHADPAPNSVASTGLEEVEAKILDLANGERTRQGLAALSMNPTLQLAARGHSSEMGQLNYFDHESPNKERKFPWDRMNLLGVDSNEVGENIFMTDGHPLNAAAEMAVRGWLSSVHHRENLLNPKFKATGLGMSKVQGRIYFTQIFAADVSPMEGAAPVPK